MKESKCDFCDFKSMLTPPTDEGSLSVLVCLQYVLWTVSGEMNAKLAWCHLTCICSLFLSTNHTEKMQRLVFTGRKTGQKLIQRPESLTRNPKSNVTAVDTLLDRFVSSWNSTTVAARHQIWWQLKRNRDIACLWWLSVCQNDNKFPKAQGKLVMKSSRGAPVKWRHVSVALVCSR